MDGSQFDHVTKGLTGKASRRGTFTTPLGGIAGGAAVATGVDAATQSH